MEFREIQAKGLERAATVERCHYLKPSGERCGSPAMRGFELCYYHDRYQPKSGYRNLPCLEDPHSVQCAIQEIIEDMLSGLLDYKKAALALYGLQTAVANLKQMRIAEKERRESEEREAREERETRTVDRAPCTEKETCPVAGAPCPEKETACPVAGAQCPEKETACPVAGAQCPDENQPATVHRAPGTTLIESPRPPQHVTRGLRTQAERRAMAQRFPDMKKARAEFLALLTPEERANVSPPAVESISTF